MQQYIGFLINANEYMFPILKVREIISMPDITAIPQFPEYVVGVTNLRGSVIPIVNLKMLLNADEKLDSGNAVIVLFSGRLVFGVIVDEVTGVKNVDDSTIAPPESFFDTDVDKISGVAKMEDRLVVLLNIKKLLPLSDASILEDSILDIRATGDGGNVEVTREVETIGGKVTVKELHDAKEYLDRSMDADDPRQDILNRMLELIDALASRNYESAEEIASKITGSSDNVLFREVGKITRKLHDSLEDFKRSLDHSLDRVTKESVPTAVDRLEFVIRRTEEAANKTMSIAERYFEESDDLMNAINKIRSPKKEANYLKMFKEQLDNDMTAIITAQQFQDITGQTIRRVITLVNELEAELVELITGFGMTVYTERERISNDSVSNKNNDDESEIGYQEPEKISQADVESLLQEFGF